MTTTPFLISYKERGLEQKAEVHPCCKENDIVDYAVYHDGKLSYTVTRPEGENKWVVAMRNADDQIVDEALQNIGAEIDKHINN